MTPRIQYLEREEFAYDIKIIDKVQMVTLKEKIDVKITDRGIITEGSATDFTLMQALRMFLSKIYRLRQWKHSP